MNFAQASNEVLVTAWIRDFGQRWSHDGGEGILTFRSLLRSGRFDRTWVALA